MSSHHLEGVNALRAAHLLRIGSMSIQDHDATGWRGITEEDAQAFLCHAPGTDFWRIQLDFELDAVPVDVLVAAARKIKGWTQTELADFFDVSRVTVSRWEGAGPLPVGPALMQVTTWSKKVVERWIRAGCPLAD